MLSPTPYTKICSDNFLDNGRTGTLKLILKIFSARLTNIHLQEFFNSTSPGVIDASESNIDLVESYIPRFFDVENLTKNNYFNPEGISDFSTGYQAPELEFEEALFFPVSDIADQNAIRTLEIHSIPSTQQSFRDSPIQNLNFEEDEPEATLGFTKTTSDDRPSLKGRKQSTTSASCPTEDYRKRHNGIEKRYRKNINAKILWLEHCLPIQAISDEEDPCPRRMTKPAILTRAMKHIEVLKQNTRRLTKEREDLNKRLSALEKLAMGMDG